MSKYLVRLGALLATAIGGFSHSVHVYAEGATIPTSDVIVGSTPLNDERPHKEGILFEQYGDWQATAESFITEDGELRTICSIHTGGDGDDSIHVSISNGDVLPPDAMPYVEYQEATARGYPTYLQGNQAVLWVVYTGESGKSYEGSTYTGIDEEGIPFANVSLKGDELSVLRGFAKGRQVVLLDEYSGGDLYVASLKGFSAAYRKMSAWCGFSPGSVLN